MKTTEQKIEFTRVNNDVNGNPRYVCHFLNLISSKENFTSLDGRYATALHRAKSLGGRKYHNRSYGGGIVFQSYNLKNLEVNINSVVSEIDRKLEIDPMYLLRELLPVCERELDQSATDNGITNCNLLARVRRSIETQTA